MIRAVLAVMAGLLCALAGLRHASGLSQEASRLRRWCQLLQHLALHLRQGVLSIPDALLACADGSTASGIVLSCKDPAPHKMESLSFWTLAPHGNCIQKTVSSP